MVLLNQTFSLPRWRVPVGVRMVRRWPRKSTSCLQLGIPTMFEKIWTQIFLFYHIPGTVQHGTRRCGSADPDPDFHSIRIRLFTLMQIRIQIFTLMRIRMRSGSGFGSSTERCKFATAILWILHGSVASLHFQLTESGYGSGSSISSESGSVYRYGSSSESGSRVLMTKNCRKKIQLKKNILYDQIF